MNRYKNSKISITLPKEEAAGLLQLGRSQADGALTDFLEEETTDIRLTDSGYVIFYWENAPWNRDSEIVKDIEDYLENECGGNYSFIRIGEELEDVEETDGDAFGNDEHTPYVYRTIVLPDVTGDLEDEAEGD